jgi:hypothetical protein
VVLEIHVEVLPAVPDSDGVYDGVQEITAMSKVWSSISRVSCNGDGARLEFSAAAVKSRAWMNTSHIERDRGVGHTRRCRSSRRVRWRSMRGRGALELR